MALLKEQNKTLEKELNETEILNESDAEVKTLVVRKLREIIQQGKNIREVMKATLSKINKYLQRTISGWEETWIQSKDLKHKEEISMQPEQEGKKKRIQRKQGQHKDPLVLSKQQRANHKDARRRRGQARNLNLV